MTTVDRPLSVAERTAGWFPSRWGPDDAAGALNEITPATVLAAVSLVRTGRVHDLAHVLHADVPAFPGRTFRSYLTTNAHFVNRRRPDGGAEGWGRNAVNWIVEQITATQQMGTHMDALNHPAGRGPHLQRAPAGRRRRGVGHQPARRRHPAADRHPRAAARRGRRPRGRPSPAR